MTEAREFNGFGTNFVGSPEPIYGGQYLPRKFKVGLTSDRFREFSEMWISEISIECTSGVLYEHGDDHLLMIICSFLITHISHRRTIWCSVLFYRPSK